MIKKLFNFVKYTGNFFMLFKIPYAWLLNKLGFEKSATNVLCKRPHILWTPFGNYLATTLFHYFCVVENYEPEIGNQIDKISKQVELKDAYLINIGANIGRWSIGLAKKYGYKVIAFEPGPSTFRNLKINTILSNLDNNIELYNVGLGNSNDIMKFSMGTECDAMGHIIKEKDVGEGVNIIDIPVKKFDDLGIEPDKLSKTRLIIMDVEGYELNVLKGMEKSLKEFHDINIIMEIRENHKDKEKTLYFMEHLGYQSTRINSDNYLFTK